MKNRKHVQTGEAGSGTSEQRGQGWFPGGGDDPARSRRPGPVVGKGPAAEEGVELGIESQAHPGVRGSSPPRPAFLAPPPSTWPQAPTSWSLWFLLGDLSLDSEVTGFIEMQVPHHAVQPRNGQNSEVFSIFAILCNHHHDPF